VIDAGLVAGDEVVKLSYWDIASMPHEELEQLQRLVDVPIPGVTVYRINGDPDCEYQFVRRSTVPVVTTLH
jgi:hypothetical protein